MKTVKGKTIIITGGAGGLGSAIAQRFAEREAVVFLLDVNEAQGQEAAAKISQRGGEAFFIKTDLTSETEWRAAVDSVLRETGRVDVLVNNAGINIRKTIEEMSMEEWTTMMKVNTGSVFLGCKMVLPIMRSQKDGVIINTSSICGFIGHRYTPEAYTATKGAVTLLTKSVAARYAKDGIRCNCVCPSTVDTPLVQTLFQDPARKRERLDEVPLGRLATTDDVAYAVLYLASDEASFLNGVALPVDGGLTCC